MHIKIQKVEPTQNSQAMKKWCSFSFKSFGEKLKVAKSKVAT